MSFKRKFWKRGDRLNAKELNRIEEGINAAQTSQTNSGYIENINVDIAYDTVNQKYVITNSDLTTERFNELFNEAPLSYFKVKISVTEENIEMQNYFYSSFINYTTEIVDENFNTAKIIKGVIQPEIHELLEIGFSQYQSENIISELQLYTMSLTQTDTNHEPSNPM